MPIASWTIFILFSFAEMTSRNEELLNMPYWRQKLLFHVLHVEAGLGYLKAEAKLGRLDLPNNNIEKRKSWLLNSAEKNWGYAQLNLGANYLYGLDGFHQDIKKALYWLERAADNDVWIAKGVLAKLYTGDDYPMIHKDLEKANYWGKKSGLKDPANGNVLESLEWALGDLHIEKAINATKPGNKIIQYKIGTYELHKGNITSGVKWLTESANQGFDKAAYELAQSYTSGKYLPQDKQKADYWFQKAIEHGSVEAINDLGVRYSKGEGVPKNPQKGFELYKLGAEKGDYAAMYNVGLAYSRLDNNLDRPVPINYELAASWYEKSMKAKEHPCTSNDLGILYATGKGVEKNQKKAKDFFIKTFELMLDDEINNYLSLEKNEAYTNSFAEGFAQYQYSLAVKENTNISMQNVSSAIKNIAKKNSERLVKLCWK